jgi:hypothetical protein
MRGCTSNAISHTAYIRTVDICAGIVKESLYNILEREAAGHEEWRPRFVLRKHIRTVKRNQSRNCKRSNKNGGRSAMRIVRANTGDQAKRNPAKSRSWYASAMPTGAQQYSRSRIRIVRRPQADPKERHGADEARAEQS